MKGSTIKLKPMCPTRWTVRKDSIIKFIYNYSLILESLEEFKDICTTDQLSKAIGLYSYLQNGKCYLDLVICSKIYSNLDSLVHVFMKEMAGTCVIVNNVKINILEQRNNLELLIDQTLKTISELDLREINMSRKRKRVTRFNNFNYNLTVTYHNFIFK